MFISAYMYLLVYARSHIFDKLGRAKDALRQQKRAHHYGTPLHGNIYLSSRGVIPPWSVTMYWIAVSGSVMMYAFITSSSAVYVTVRGSIRGNDAALGFANVTNDATNTHNTSKNIRNALRSSSLRRFMAPPSNQNASGGKASQRPRAQSRSIRSRPGIALLLPLVPA